jgi:hypothetical protein
MRDASARITGVRLRRPDGSKWAVKGSSEGLFYAPGKIGQTVYVAEGASDVAAMMTLGLSAVGKPSAQGGGPALAGMLAGLDVVLILSGKMSGNGCALAPTRTEYAWQRSALRR